MKLFNIFRKSKSAPDNHQTMMAQASAGMMFTGFDDPAFKEFVRTGSGSGTSVEKAMQNTAVLRCVSMISYAIGALPMHLMDSRTKEKNRDHPLYKVLHRQPNNWQTSFNFRQLLQRRALVDGNGYALLVKSGNRVVSMVPLESARVTPKQRDDWSVEYHYQRPDGGVQVLQPDDVLHVYADSDDGISGVSLVKRAGKAIELAGQIENSQINLFLNNMQIGGVITHPQRLGKEGLENIRKSLEDLHRGSDNAGRWAVFEEGMKATEFKGSNRESQQVETRNTQVEEIGRVFGVPRPFLGMDDTSWGTGIDVLGQMFVRYSLSPWFTAWEQAIERACLSDADQDRFDVKFNSGGLLRGSMKDQAEFFAKALGSGGHQPWMTYQEVRDLSDLPEKEVGPNMMTAASNGT